MAPQTATISGIVVTRQPARLVVTTAPATTVLTLAQIVDAPGQLVTIVGGNQLDFGVDAAGGRVVYQVVGWTEGPPPGLMVALVVPPPVP